MNDFKDWLNSNRDARVSEVFHDIIANFDELKSELAEYRAARIAYASEFPLGEDGQPNVGSIHQNIRGLRTELSELRAEREALKAQEPVEYQFQGGGGKWHQFLHQKHYDNTVADGRWPIRALYLSAGAKEEQND